MTAYEIITKKRDGKSLNDDELRHFIEGYTSGRIADYQMAAFLMAVFFRGMSDDEIRVLTEVMIRSGAVINLDDIEGIKVDKHSTGGVGDKVSIILAPVVAAAGVPVPMISGRGLGHTGGTLDKLESIPDFNVNLSVTDFKRLLKENNACLIGQTDNLVPADKKLYGLRDVTATVPAIPLITSSIMSKKIAEGINALVLDVKTGSGAFLPEMDKAIQLAEKLINVGSQFGIKTVAYLTNMDQPLGRAVGNWLEIEECVNCLQGKRSDDLMEVTHQLCGAMIHLGGKAESAEEGVAISKQMIESGKAWDKFLQLTEAQGGDISYLENPQKYGKTEFAFEVTAEQDGFIAGINALEVGLTSVMLGAGRQRADDPIDSRAGILIHKKQGDAVSMGDKIMTLCTDREAAIRSAEKRLKGAVSYTPEPVEKSKMILKYIE